MNKGSTTTLNKLNVNDEGIVYYIDNFYDKCDRLLDLGVVSGTKIKALHESPFGNICAYQIMGSVIAIRDEDAQNITILR